VPQLADVANRNDERFFDCLETGYAEVPNDDSKKEKRMSNAIDNLQAAQKRAMEVRPKVGGFPYLAEVLRRAGVTKNLWFLPSCQNCT
jgi:hypothetical protein